MAAAAYRGINDPAGMATADSVALAGPSFSLTVDGGRLTFTLRRAGDGLWIEGAAGQGTADLTAQGLRFIEAMAKAAQLDRVSFQTARPGLVRKATRAGYTVAGWILTKDTA